MKEENDKKIKNEIKENKNYKRKVYRKIKEKMKLKRENI